MSIGKKLLSLRQQKGLSQQELANYLHVSRQTVSKWESDMNLPDMNMILSIASFYNITINELLGLDEETSEESLKHLYNQTNTVLSNIQNENKKRVKLDIFIIGICLLSLFVSIVLLIKVTKKQPSTTIVHHNTNTTIHDNKIYGTAKTDIVSYDLNKMNADVSVKLELNGINKNSVATMCLKDINGQLYQYTMKRITDLEFEYIGTIPIIEYEDVYVMIQQEDKTYKFEDISINMRHSIREFLEDSIHLSVGLDGEKQVHDKICYKLDKPMRDLNVLGIEETKITFIIEDENGNVLLNETIDYNKDAVMYTSRNLKLLEELNIQYIINHAGVSYKGNHHVKYVYSSNFIAHRQLIG
jgi:transcriptional regulator with XRE-family HTH domain